MLDEASEIARGIHPVVDLIHRRLAEGTRPRERADPHVLALAIEGGGMRGVQASGMVAMLARLGTRPAFDRVYGSSAGAMMGAYFVAGQGALTPSIYIRDLSNRRFISRRRFLTLGRRPVLDLDYLVDDVMGKITPLDYDAVLASPIELHVLATSLRTGKSLDSTGFRTKESLREAMRAAARLPFLAGRPVALDGELCYDSGLTDSLAYTAALAGGATHVLALKTRSAGEVPETFSGRQEWLMRHVLRVEPRAVELLLGRAARYDRETAELDRLCGLGPDATPQVFAIGPSPEDPVITRLCRTRAELEVGARAGVRAVSRAFGLAETPYRSFE